MSYTQKQVDEFVAKLRTSAVLEEAAETVRAGFPLDEDMQLALLSVGVDPDDIEKEFADDG